MVLLQGTPYVPPSSGQQALAYPASVDGVLSRSRAVSSLPAQVSLSVAPTNEASMYR